MTMMGPGRGWGPSLSCAFWTRGVSEAGHDSACVGAGGRLVCAWLWGGVGRGGGGGQVLRVPGMFPTIMEAVRRAGMDDTV